MVKLLVAIFTTEFNTSSGFCLHDLMCLCLLWQCLKLVYNTCIQGFHSVSIYLLLSASHACQQIKLQNIVLSKLYQKLNLMKQEVIALQVNEKEEENLFISRYKEKKKKWMSFVILHLQCNDFLFHSIELLILNQRNTGTNSMELKTWQCLSFHVQFLQLFNLKDWKPPSQLPFCLTF